MTARANAPVARPAYVKPPCPKCDSLLYIKVKRNADGTLLVRCLDCEHQATMTSAEYYRVLDEVRR